MADVSVFIDSSTYKILQDLSAQTGRKTEEIVNKAVELYRRKLLLDKTNAAFTALKADSQAWKEEQEESGVLHESNSKHHAKFVQNIPLPDLLFL